LLGVPLVFGHGPGRLRPPRRCAASP
jgi:hypothetical protein